MDFDDHTMMVRLQKASHTMFFLILALAVLLFVRYPYAPNENAARNNHDYVAFCFSGHARTFLDRHVRENIKTQVIKSIAGEISYHNFFVIAGSPQILAEVLQDFHPFTLLLANDTLPPQTGCPFHSWNKWTQGFYGQFYKIQQCYNLVLEYERQSQKLFDYIIRVRPDQVWKEKFKHISGYSKDAITSPTWVQICPDNFPKEILNQLRLKIVGDNFAIIPRTFADIYMNTADDIYLCRDASFYVMCHMSISIAGVPPECILQRRLYDYRVNVEFDENVGVLVREVVGDMAVGKEMTFGYEAHIAFNDHGIDNIFFDLLNRTI